MDGCALHNWCNDFILLRKGVLQAKHLSVDTSGFGEVEYCNLALMCSISGAVNNCICISVSVSVSLRFRKWCTLKVTIYFSFIYTRML